MRVAVNRWWVVVAFMLVGAATQISWLVLAPVTTVAAEHYRVSDGAIGWSAQVFPLLYVVLAIPAGMLLDRWFRGGLAAGAGLTALGSVVRLVGDDYTWVLVGQTVNAIGQPLVLNAITGLVLRYLAPRSRPLGIALATASAFAGMVVAFGLGAVFSAEHQVRTLLVIGAVFAVVAAGALLAALRRPGAYDPGTVANALVALCLAWRHTFLRPVLVVVFVGFGGSIALMTWLQALLEPAGVSASTAGTMLLVLVLAGVVGCTLLPPWIARRGQQAMFLFLAVAVMSAGCVLLAVAPGVLVGFVTMTLIGMVLLTALPVVLELVERRAGEEAGTATGLVWMAGNLGGFAVAFGVQALLDTPRVAFLVLAGVATLALPAIAVLDRILPSRMALEIR